MSMRCTGFHVQRCNLSQILWQATVARERFDLFIFTMYTHGEDVTTRNEAMGGHTPCSLLKRSAS
jgi:hypothetical protein